MINLKTLDNYAGDFDGLSKEQADELEKKLDLHSAERWIIKRFPAFVNMEI